MPSFARWACVLLLAVSVGSNAVPEDEPETIAVHGCGTCIHFFYLKPAIRCICSFLIPAPNIMVVSFIATFTLAQTFIKCKVVKLFGALIFMGATFVRCSRQTRFGAKYPLFFVPQGETKY